MIRSPTFRRPSVWAGPPGDQAFNFRIAVFRPQHRADADERQAHVDAEIFQVGFAQIFRMRIVSLGEGVEEKLYLLVLVLLVNVAGQALVALCDQFRPGLDRMFAQMFLEQFAHDPATPDVVGFRLILRPGRFLPAQLNSRVALEIDGLIELLLDLGDAIVHPLGVEIVDFVGRLQISQEHIVIERGAVFRQSACRHPAG